MDAVILAAGRGSRLKPLTNTKHKTLLSVGNESILEHQIKTLNHAGIETVHLVTGYRHDEVSDAAENLTANLTISLNTIHSTKWNTTDNLYSLSLAESVVRSSPFVLSNADVFADQAIVDALCESSQAIVPYDSNMFHPEALKLDLDQNESPSGILDKGAENGAGATIGMFSFDSAASTKLFDDINTHINVDGEKTQWFEASLDRIFPNSRFDVIDVADWRWMEIDTEEDLQVARKTWTDESAGTNLNSTD